MLKTSAGPLSSPHGHHAPQSVIPQGEDSFPSARPAVNAPLSFEILKLPKGCLRQISGQLESDRLPQGEASSPGRRPAGDTDTYPDEGNCSFTPSSPFPVSPVPTEETRSAFHRGAGSARSRRGRRDGGTPRSGSFRPGPAAGCGPTSARMRD